MSIPQIQNWVGACMAIVGSAHIAVAMHSLPGPIAVHLHMLPDLSVESEKIPLGGHLPLETNGKYVGHCGTYLGLGKIRNHFMGYYVGVVHCQ